MYCIGQLKVLQSSWDTTVLTTDISTAIQFLSKNVNY